MHWLLIPCLLGFQDPAPESPPKAQDPIRHIDQDLAAGWVRELVELGPRMGGTPSGAAAAEYLRRALSDLGLRTRLIEDPETWAHWEEPWELWAEAAGRDGSEAERLDFPQAWPYGFSPSAAGSWPLSLDPQDAQVTLFDKAHQIGRAHV